MDKNQERMIAYMNFILSKRSKLVYINHSIRMIYFSTSYIYHVIIA